MSAPDVILRMVRLAALEAEDRRIQRDPIAAALAALNAERAVDGVGPITEPELEALAVDSLAVERASKVDALARAEAAEAAERDSKRQTGDHSAADAAEARRAAAEARRLALGA